MRPVYTLALLALGGACSPGGSGNASGTPTDSGMPPAQDASADATEPPPDAVGLSADAADSVPDAAESESDAGGPVPDAGETFDARADAMPPPDGGAPPYPPPRSSAEVLLVYNANSPISTAVANDYAQKRKVTNVISVQCPDSAVNSGNETIALSDYTANIATPISQYLQSHTNIQFIVLTKGIPIRINGAMSGCCANSTSSPGQPSLDSYLAAIDYPSRADTKKIGITGSGTIGSGWLNRYWNASVPFTHAQFGGYLVTRLDGYTQADAQSLVTRALAAEQGGGTGKVLFDVPQPFGLGDKATQPSAVTGTISAESSYDTWNADMLHGHDVMEATGIPNELDLATLFIGGRSNLVGYFSWGSNDPFFNNSAYQSLTFAPGSMADTAVSTSGRTFLPTAGGQSLLVDLIAHGLTSGKGYVGEPILQAVASPAIALARYYSGYSMAESLYAASRFVGWEDVVVGDPLCTPHSGSRIVVPIPASNYDSSSAGVQKEACAEGGSDIGRVNGSEYTVYKAVPLTGATTLAVRVASGGAGGNVELHIDSATGTLLGTCAVPATGGWQTWSTQTCALTGANGVHDVYLVYAGSGSGLFSLQWFSLR
jgi:uncharacterized protein (TIGR03790 family)